VTLLLALDLLGVFVFGLSGGLRAVERRFDVFGVVVLALVTGLGGGLARDVLLGDVPPAALRDDRYLVAAVLAGAVVFVGARLVERLGGAVRLFDAAGLGLFVVSGTAKALDAGLGALPAIVIGCLAGIGGGVLRDLLAGVVPIVLRPAENLYAVPALLGATAVVLADGAGVSGPESAVGAATLVFAVRMASVWRDWHAPVSPAWRRRGSGPDG
jgi:uncharacterized membrane protein YeiH